MRVFAITLIFSAFIGIFAGEVLQNLLKSEIKTSFSRGKRCSGCWTLNYSSLPGGEPIPPYALPMTSMELFTYLSLDIVNGEKNKLYLIVENKAEVNATLGTVAGSFHDSGSQVLVKNVRFEVMQLCSQFDFASIDLDYKHPRALSSRKQL